MAKILIADDEPELVLLMRIILENAGHAISEAGNGEEALIKLGVCPDNPAVLLPDLLLLDVVMPVLDGLAVVTALRAHPRAANLPILVISGKSNIRSLFTAMPQVVGFFSKPFNPEALRTAIERALPPRSGADT